MNKEFSNHRVRYTLRQIEVFLATAHHENISKAADELAMSQSAASMALKELEAQWQVQLFNRVGKRLQLSSVGKSMRSAAQNLLAQASDIEQTMRLHNEQGTVQVGATLTIGNYLLMDIIKSYQLANDADIAVHIDNTEQMLTSLLDYSVDIALLEGEANHADIHFEPWFDDELVIFCSPGHALAKKQVLLDEDLLQASWVLRELGSGTRKTFENIMSGIFPQLDIAFELEQTEAIKSAVANGLGLGFLSALSVEAEIASGKLVALPLATRKLQRKFYLAWHREKYFTHGLSSFLGFCRDHAKP